MSDQVSVLIAQLCGSPLSPKPWWITQAILIFLAIPRMAMPLGERPVFACIAWHQASQMCGLIARQMIRVTAYNSPNS
jgi:hypothetical protein